MLADMMSMMAPAAAAPAPKKRKATKRKAAKKAAPKRKAAKKATKKKAAKKTTKRKAAKKATKKKAASECVRERQAQRADVKAVHPRDRLDGADDEGQGVDVRPICGAPRQEPEIARERHVVACQRVGEEHDTDRKQRRGSPLVVGG